MRLLSILIILLLSITNTLAQVDDTSACISDDVAYLPPQLIIGEQARIAVDIQLNVRPNPTLDEARLGTLAGGTHVTVLDGPICGEQFLWWQVESPDLIGWVAEGSLADKEYFIVPRGEVMIVETDYGDTERYIRTANNFLEPEGCLRPPDDYEQIQLGFATLNQRTIFMLDNAQRIYEADGGTWATFRWLITQGSYNRGGVAASFGTHDAGGAVDISVIDTQNGWVVMRDEVPAMLRALRIAGFAAWLRDTDELYDGSIVHIHAIAIGDEDASEIAQQQVSSEFGYLSGYNGLPPADYGERIPDIYGAPIICEWMVDAGFEDIRD